MREWLYDVFRERPPSLARQLSQRGALVLGIERTDGFVATPTGCDRIEAGDRLIVYGNLGTLRTELGAELAPAT